jgi:succinate-acetate transporter protein
MKRSVKGKVLLSLSILFFVVAIVDIITMNSIVGVGSVYIFIMVGIFCPYGCFF